MSKGRPRYLKVTDSLRGSVWGELERGKRVVMWNFFLFLFLALVANTQLHGGGDGVFVRSHTCYP